MKTPTAPRKSGKEKPSTARSAAAQWPRRFLLRLLVWILPVAAFWAVATPFYNRFLIVGSEKLVRMTESPPVTRLVPRDRHFVLLTRSDSASAKGFLYSIRVTDVHFNWILLGAFFLAIPDVDVRRRAENLGWAALATVFFHLVSLFLYVKFAYATQLGEWSLTHFSATAREAWGMAKHVFDLPLKFSWPLLLWSFFYFREVFPPRTLTGD